MSAPDSTVVCPQCHESIPRELLNEIGECDNCGCPAREFHSDVLGADVSSLPTNHICEDHTVWGNWLQKSNGDVGCLGKCEVCGAEVFIY